MDLKMPQKSGFQETSSYTTSTTPPPKSSSSAAFTAPNDPKVSCSPNEQLASVSASKSSSNCLRKRTESKSTRLSTSGSLQRKSCLGNSTSSTRMSSISKHSSSALPASPIDGWSWSSESFSSSSAIKQISKDLEARTDTTALKGGCLGSDSTQASCPHSPLPEQSSLCQEIQETGLSNHCVGRSLQGTALVSAESTRNFKPSGLRMPSPKIGFFDEEKSMEQTVREGLQFNSGVHSDSPNINGATNKKRLNKDQPARTSQEVGNMKFGSQQRGVLNPDSGNRPKHTAEFQELDNASQNVSTSETMKSYSTTAAEAPIDMCLEMDGENCFKTRKIGPGVNDRRKVRPNFGLTAVGKRTKGRSKNKMGIESKRQQVGTGVLEAKNPFGTEHKEASQHNLENSLNVHKKSEKKNISNFADQVNGLRKYFEVIDLSGDVVIELKERSNSHPHLADNHPEKPSALCFPTQPICCNLQQDLPGSLSKPYLPFVPSTRTPLADKTSVCNRNGSVGLIMESTREKSLEKVSTSLFR